VGPEVVVNGHAFYALSPQNVTVLVEGELPEDDNGVREDAPLARGFELAAPWPNPFNSSVALRYRLDRPGRAVLTVHDLLGRRVATLAQGAHGAGRHEARWDGRSGEGSPVASGSYIVRLATDRGGRAVRVVLLR
jgi:hypothetical protein